MNCASWNVHKWQASCLMLEWALSKESSGVNKIWKMFNFEFGRWTERVLYEFSFLFQYTQWSASRHYWRKPNPIQILCLWETIPSRCVRNLLMARWKACLTWTGVLLAELNSHLLGLTRDVCLMWNKADGNRSAWSFLSSFDLLYFVFGTSHISYFCEGTLALCKDSNL